MNEVVYAYRVWRVEYLPLPDSDACPPGYHIDEKHSCCVPDTKVNHSRYSLTKALTEHEFREHFKIETQATVTPILDKRMKNGGREVK